jgi:hypothetical protein
MVLEGSPFGRREGGAGEADAEDARCATAVICQI